VTNVETVIVIANVEIVIVCDEICLCCEHDVYFFMMK